MIIKNSKTFKEKKVIKEELIMYITDTTENVRKIFEMLDERDDVAKMKFLIYIFDLATHQQINDKNEVNPNLIEDDDLIIFNLEDVGMINNYADLFLEYLVMTFNMIATNLSNKCYQNDGNVEGIYYDKFDKILLSNFEKLSYNEKLDIFGEIFIKIENDSFFDKKYKIISLNTNGYDIASNITKLKLKEEND